MKVMSASEIRKRFMKLIKNLENEPLLVVNNYKPQAVLLNYDMFLKMENEIKMLQLAISSMKGNNEE